MESVYGTLIPKINITDHKDKEDVSEFMWNFFIFTNAGKPIFS
jgi:hypothetical protein